MIGSRTDMNEPSNCSRISESIRVKRDPSSAGSSSLKDSSRSSKGGNVAHNQRNNLTQRRRNLIPVNYGPYKPKAVGNSQSSCYSTAQSSVSAFTQKVMSAKLLRVKQLQNQLSETQNQLNEVMNENRLLRNLQKRQAAALQRFEGSQDQLPQLIRSHNEEIRVMNTKLKHLKEKYNEVESKLKRRDLEYSNLKEHHKHLLKLSQDKQLFDREKLAKKLEVMEIKEKEYKEKIQMLNRKLELEGKNYKYQLGVESTKLKETQNDLKSALGTINSLKAALEAKEKYVNSTLPKKYRKSMEQLLQNSHVSLPVPPRVSIRKPQKIGEGGSNNLLNDESSSDSEISYHSDYGNEKENFMRNGKAENEYENYEKKSNWGNTEGDTKSNCSSQERRRSPSLRRVKISPSDDSLDGLKLDLNENKKRLFTNMGNGAKEIEPNYIIENSKLQAKLKSKKLSPDTNKDDTSKGRSRSGTRVRNSNQPMRLYQSNVTGSFSSESLNQNFDDYKLTSYSLHQDIEVELNETVKLDDTLNGKFRKSCNQLETPVNLEHSRTTTLPSIVNDDDDEGGGLNKLSNLSWDEMTREVSPKKEKIIDILKEAHPEVDNSDVSNLNEEQKVNLLKMLNEIDDEENTASGNDSKTFQGFEVISEKCDKNGYLDEFGVTKKKEDILKDIFG